MAHETAESVWLRTRQSLLARVKGERDESAWQEFYQMYWRAVYGYAIHFGMPPQAAEDIVQEVFIKLLRRLPEFCYDRRKGRFLSWVKTVTRSTVIDHYRRLQRRMEGGVREEPDEEGKSPLERIPADLDRDQPDWDREVKEAMLVTALERVQTRVKPVNFQAFRRYAINDEDAEEVASDLGISRNAVFIAKNRILKMLRDEVESIHPEYE